MAHVAIPIVAIKSHTMLENSRGAGTGGRGHSPPPKRFPMLN